MSVLLLNGASGIEMARIYAGVGSNIDGEQNVRKGVNALQDMFGELIISPVYESESVGFAGKNFFNLVVGFDSTETPEEISAGLFKIESRFGRNREGVKISSRTLDLDLLLYDDLVIDGNDLQIPRKDILKYAFVLRPLADVAGDRVHPVSGRSYQNLWNSFDQQSQKLWQVNIEIG